jgi:hypothetical protein
MSIKAMKATPHKQLIDELMDCRIPKTEREHAAAREIERLRQAIEEAEKQEPVAWSYTNARGREEIVRTSIAPYEDATPLYAHPQPKREWVGLTDEEIGEIEGVEMKYIGTGEYVIDGEYEFAKAIEAKLREKNT